MNGTHEGSATPGVAGTYAGTTTVQRFEEIYDAYYATVARWVRCLGGPTADREDLVQDVFVIVYRRLADFDGRNVVGWLYRITAHHVRDYRRLIWIKHIFRRSVALSSEMPSFEPTPVTALETRERQRRLERLLAKLSDTLRVTFVLFEIEGYTAEEIAEMQSVQANTVRARIHRARKKMEALLDSPSNRPWRVEETAGRPTGWSDACNELVPA
ncbi:MAG TPA: sigma-70 family RNA polymerase sigma factor [Polyangia bacterium]|nr:sigma-70 family RNA polymerase sigma factor [Polyangia bacterium]